MFDTENEMYCVYSSFTGTHKKKLPILYDLRKNIICGSFYLYLIFRCLMSLQEKMNIFNNNLFVLENVSEAVFYPWFFVIVKLKNTAFHSENFQKYSMHHSFLIAASKHFIFFSGCCKVITVDACCTENRYYTHTWSRDSKGLVQERIATLLRPALWKEHNEVI